MKTRAAILRESNKPLDIDYVEVPQLGTGQVLVKVHYSGLCGAQINEITGLKGEDKYLPHLLGHEGYGTVLEVGDGVTKVEKDNIVILTWLIGAGLEGGPKKYGKCNAGSITTFQEYSVISENRLIPINDKPSPRFATFGCMLPTGCGTIVNLSSGDSVRIFGAGNIGSAAIIAANQMGKRVYVVDIVKKKLKYALNLGADVVNLPTDELDKVDTAIDTTGKVSVIEQAFDTIKDTGKLILVGNTTVGNKVSFPPFDFIKGKTVIGSWGGGCRQPDIDILHLAHTINISSIPIETYPLESINKAVAKFKAGACEKILVECMGD